MCRSFLFHLLKKHNFWLSSFTHIPRQHKCLSMIILDMDSIPNLSSSIADVRCCCHCSYLVMPKIVLPQWLWKTVKHLTWTLEDPCFCSIQHTANTVTSYSSYLVPMDKAPLAKTEHLKQP